MDIAQTVYQNSLNTCEYLDGYVNRSSVIRVRCIEHDLIFTTKYENVARANRAHHICPKCQEADRLEKRNAVEVTCAYCGKKFLKPESKLTAKSGLYFCCREHKDLAQCCESGERFDTMRPKHYGTTQQNYRDLAFRHFEHKCSLCGWDEIPQILEVHHKDSNRSNNSIDNLVMLCPICHRKVTYGYASIQ